MSNIQTDTINGHRKFDHKIQMEGTDHLNLNGSQSVGSNAQIAIPRGTTDQRPASPSAGMIRLNTDTDRVELYDGTEWVDHTTIPGQGVDTGTAAIGIFSLPEAYFTIIDNASSGGTLLYVDSMTGDDNHSGTSPSLALASISRAVELATDGYTIYIMPGIHTNMPTDYLRTGRDYGHGVLDDYGKNITFIGFPGRTVIRINDDSEIGYPHATSGNHSYLYGSAYGPYPGGMINESSRAIGIIVEKDTPSQTNAVAGHAMFSQDAGGYTSPAGLRGEYTNCVFRNVTTTAGDGTYNNKTTYTFQFNNGVFEAPFTGNNYLSGNSGSTMSAVGYTRDSFPTSGMGTIDQSLITMNSVWQSSVIGYGVYEGTYAWDSEKVLPYPGATGLVQYSVAVNENDGANGYRAATSGTALKTTLGSGAKNGAYWYRFSDGAVRKLYTDFTTYSNYVFVMVTRIWDGSQDQWMTSDVNVSDLALTPDGTAPSRHAKLADTYMNDIISPNTIRWGMAGNGGTFYRLDDDPKWYSNHGQNQTCTYARGFYDAYASPSNSPTWDTTFDAAYQSCGGLHDGSWLTLTGIHVADGTYFGGYSGANAARVAPPAPYNGVDQGGNSEWGRNGWVLLSW